MNFLLRLMGSVAKMSHEGSRQSINGIPSNILVVVISGFVGLMFVGFAHDGNPLAYLLVIPCVVVSLAFIVSILRGNTFFVAEPLPTTLPVAAGDGALDTNLRWTGRLRLHEKCAQRFINIPATATRLKDGSFAVVSNIDASTRFYSFVTSSKVGLWLAIPQMESLSIEAGTLYYGFLGAPSLRLKFVDGSDGRKAGAIVSFNSEGERGALLAWLQNEKSRAVPAGSAQRTPNSPFSNSTGTV